MIHHGAEIYVLSTQWYEETEFAAKSIAGKFQDLKINIEVYDPDSLETGGTEKDGLRRGRSGEGKNHKRLRLRVKNNPGEVEKRLAGARAETEVELLSGDRVDVMCFAKNETVAIEVKSRDSACHDLQRGIYQCVKYRAVLRAQDAHPPVRAWLVTESELEGDVRELAKKLKVKHKIVQPPR